MTIIMRFCSMMALLAVFVTSIGCFEQSSSIDKSKTYTKDEVLAMLTPKDFTDGGKILEKAGSSVFPVYEDILADPEIDVPQKTCIYSVLSRLDCDRRQFYPYCIEHLQYDDRDGLLRILVTRLLIQIGTTVDVPILCALLSDEWIGVSYSTANQLPQIGDQNALDALNVWIVVHGPSYDQRTQDIYINSRDKLKARLDKMEQPVDKE